MYGLLCVTGSHWVVVSVLLHVDLPWPSLFVLVDR